MQAALFDLDETLLDRSGSLRDFVTWQSQEIFKAGDANTNTFIERFIVLDQKGMVWKDRVYELLIQEFGLKGWTVDQLLDIYVTRFCEFCRPRLGAEKVVEAFQRRGFKPGLVYNLVYSRD
ncbi:hypothetical protein AB833_32070 [Chromatiales bacterium (ex Bugula neritina AB1)]|nr:hypothetical protein AB833_32070 [Chromatiales bacterium (ex Bugula neritina AB1)]